VRAAAREIIATAGSLQPSQIKASHALEISDTIRRATLAHSTRAVRAAAVRNLLRFLWEHHGAPKLDSSIARYAGIRPRNITIADDERDALLAAAKPHVRLWLLFCADLAIRSGTAARLGPAEYDQQRRQLTFTTKCDEHVTLPTTAAIELLLDDCNMRDPTPFVRQLWPDIGSAPPIGYAKSLAAQWRRLCARVGITRHIVPHDLRRTAAVSIYRHTGDIRDAQALLGHKALASTLWYLDHDVRPIKRSTLELIKSPAWRKEQTA
jgi:integrase